MERDKKWRNQSLRTMIEVTCIHKNARNILSNLVSVLLIIIIHLYVNIIIVILEVNGNLNKSSLLSLSLSLVFSNNLGHHRHRHLPQSRLLQDQSNSVGNPLVPPLPLHRKSPPLPPLSLPPRRPSFLL